MSSWARVGVKCVCIKRGTNWTGSVTKKTYTDGPKAGEVCEITEVVEHMHGVGIRVRGYGYLYTIKKFRPAVDIKDDIALFHALCPGLPVVPPAVVPKRVTAPSHSD